MSEKAIGICLGASTISAVELIKNEDFGRMVALQGNKIVSIELEEAISKSKTVDMELYEIAKVFFG